MPAVSKAQQRLMAAAEHGANFPMARKLRGSMTHQQLHDFAAGSMKNKPERASTKRQLHPKMVAHGQRVKEAHAHLSKAIPGFRQLPPRQQMMATQEHVRQRKKNGY